MALASLSLPYKVAFLAKQTKYLMTKYPTASSPARLFLLLINKPERVRSTAMCGGPPDLHPREGKRFTPAVDVLNHKFAIQKSKRAALAVPQPLKHSALVSLKLLAAVKQAE